MPTAAEIQEYAKGYADEALSESKTFMEQATAVAESMSGEMSSVIDAMSFDAGSFGAISLNDLPDAPDASGKIELAWNRALDDLALYELPTDLGLPSAPGEFTKVAPDMADRTAPDVLDPFVGNAPVVDYTKVAPTLTEPGLPTAPTLAAVALPEVPSYTLPTFDENFEYLEVDLAVADFTFSENLYTSTLMDSLKVKLLNDLVNGGYGIETADEAGLWNRAREREQMALDANLQDIGRQAAARGFTLPPGAYFAQIEAARQTALQKMSDLSRDIALKRADMYVENRKFTIQESRELEQLLSNIYGFYMERALKAATATVELGVSLYNARIAQLNARLEVYKTKAVVYETQLKAALAPLEVYKLQLEGAKLSVDVQQAAVSVYSAQIDGARALVEIHKARVDAYIAELEGEKTKVDVFRSQVEAYAAQAQAKSVELQAYRAQIDGDIAKMQGYKTEVDAYLARVESYKALASVKQMELQTIESYNRAKTVEFDAKVKKYLTEFDVEKTEVVTNLESWRTRVDIWKNETQALLQERELIVKSALDEREVALRTAQSKVQAAKAQGDMMLGYSQSLLNVNTEVGKTYVSAVNGYLSQAVGIAAKIETESE